MREVGVSCAGGAVNQTSGRTKKKHVDPSVEATQASTTEVSVRAKQLSANNHQAEVSVTEF